MSNHYIAELTVETAEAIAANTNHCVTGFYFFKFLKGIQVGNVLIPIKIKLTGDFAVKKGVQDKVITVRDTGFFDENEQRIDDIATINLILGEAGFTFGVRFKWQCDLEKTKMFVN